MGSREGLGVAGGGPGSPGREEGASIGEEGELAAARVELAAARREIAEARLEAQGFAQMGHEIRTLLSGVLGIGGLLVATDLSAEQREYARRIRSSGEALLSIVNDIRDFSKLEADTLEIELVDFDLRRALEDVGDVLAERAHDAGTELVVVIRPDVPWVVRGDVARLRQILLSLATFAIRSCPGGEVALRAALAGDAPGAARVRFEVRYLPRVGDDGGAVGLGGGGLGIAIAKRLVDAMGGEIGAASEPALGSSFWLVLPLARRGRSTDRGLIPRIDLAGKRALVVDDSAAARDAIREMVEMIGMACDVAASRAEGAAALRSAAARREPYDVAIVDAELAEAGPDTSAEPFEEAARAAPTPLVMLSHPGAAGLGEATPLAKPIRSGLLHARLLTLLGSPLERVPAGARAAISPGRREAAAPESTSGGRTQILVVEDDVTNQKVAAFMVERRGYRVDVVGGGRTAVEAVLRGGYAAVLMDCQMPSFDGYAATAEIRRQEAARGLRRTPIFAMTAHVGSGVRDRCFAAGMDEYLSKPLVYEELDRALRTWSPAARSGSYEAVRPGGRASAPSAPVAPLGRAATPKVMPSVMPARPTTPAPALLEAAPDAHSRLATHSGFAGLPLALGFVPPAQRPGERDVLAEVMQLLLTEAPAKVGAMRAAAAAGEMGELGRLARELHEGAAALGVLHLRNLAARLERQARAGTPEDAVEAVRAIEQEVERSRLSLSRDLQRPRGRP